MISKLLIRPSDVHLLIYIIIVGLRIFYNLTKKRGGITTSERRDGVLLFPAGISSREWAPSDMHEGQTNVGLEGAVITSLLFPKTHRTLLRSPVHSGRRLPLSHRSTPPSLSFPSLSPTLSSKVKHPPPLLRPPPAFFFFYPDIYLCLSTLRAYIFILHLPSLRANQLYHSYFDYSVRVVFHL